MPKHNENSVLDGNYECEGQMDIEEVLWYMGAYMNLPEEDCSQSEKNQCSDSIV